MVSTVMTDESTENKSQDSDQNELSAWRAEIDVLDAQLLEVLSRRVQVVIEVGRYKKKNGLEPFDPVRWQQVLNGNIERGHKLNLSKEVVEQLYHLIHDYSLELERDSE